MCHDSNEAIEKLCKMKKLLTTNGEMVEVTNEKRDLGHGEEVRVIYSDGTEGWESVNDLQD